MSTKPRPAVLSDVVVQVGLLACTVSLVPLKKSKKSVESTDVKKVSVCPTCEEAVPLQTLSFCSEHPQLHGPIGRNDAHKAVKKDGILVKVSAEDLAEAEKPTVDPKRVTLSVFPALQVERHTMPGGNIYWLRPSSPEFYGLLHEMVSSETLAFIGEATVKGVTKLYRALPRETGVVLVELLRPDELHEPESVELVADSRLAGQGEILAAALVEEFVPEDWHDAAQARLRSLRDSLDPNDPGHEVLPSGDVDDLLAGIRQLKRDAA